MCTPKLERSHLSFIYFSDTSPTVYDYRCSLFFTMPSWTDLAADKKRRQQEAIPREWLITPPPETMLNVTGLPDSCGLLTPRELEITNEDVKNLLKKLASCEWSAVEVTTAFYKRAIIAQQLVSSSGRDLLLWLTGTR